MDGSTQEVPEGFLEPGPGGAPNGRPAGAGSDYSEYVQKAIAGFRAAEAMLADWEAKTASRLRMD